MWRGRAARAGRRAAAVTPSARSPLSDESRLTGHILKMILVTRQIWRAPCLGVGVPALAGLACAVLVAASPVRPVQLVGPVSPGWRDDGVAQEPQQFRDGDRDQPGVQVRAGVVLALRGDGDGEVDVGEQADRVPAVPGPPADDLPGVQAGALLAELVILFDGLITNGKFCCVRRVQLSLTWWHRPLRLRGSAFQSDVVLAGEPDEPDLERVPSAQPEPRRRAPVGSGLSAAGASGRAGRPAGSEADRGGGA
jgi:hypothetical protein